MSWLTRIEALPCGGHFAAHARFAAGVLRRLRLPPVDDPRLVGDDPAGWDFADVLAAFADDRWDRRWETRVHRVKNAARSFDQTDADAWVLAWALCRLPHPTLRDPGGDAGPGRLIEAARDGSLERRLVAAPAPGAAGDPALEVARSLTDVGAAPDAQTAQDRQRAGLLLLATLPPADVTAAVARHAADAPRIEWVRRTLGPRPPTGWLWRRLGALGERSVWPTQKHVRQSPFDALRTLRDSAERVLVAALLPAERRDRSEDDDGVADEQFRWWELHARLTSGLPFFELRSPFATWLGATARRGGDPFADRLRFAAPRDDGPGLPLADVPDPDDVDPTVAAAARPLLELEGLAGDEGFVAFLQAAAAARPGSGPPAAAAARPRWGELLKELARLGYPPARLLALIGMSPTQQAEARARAGALAVRAAAWRLARTTFFPREATPAPSRPKPAAALETWRRGSYDVLWGALQRQSVAAEGSLIATLRANATTASWPANTVYCYAREARLRVDVAAEGWNAPDDPARTTVARVVQVESFAALKKRDQPELLTALAEVGRLAAGARGGLLGPTLAWSALECPARGARFPRPGATPTLAAFLAEVWQAQPEEAARDGFLAWWESGDTAALSDLLKDVVACRDVEALDGFLATDPRIGAVEPGLRAAARAAELQRFAGALPADVPRAWVVPLYWGTCVTGRTADEQVRWLTAEGDVQRAARTAAEKAAVALRGGARPLVAGTGTASGARAQEMAS